MKTPPPQKKKSKENKSVDLDALPLQLDNVGGNEGEDVTDLDTGGLDPDLVDFNRFDESESINRPSDKLFPFNS